MYWPLLNVYLESSGFGLRGVHIRGDLLLGEGISILHTPKQEEVLTKKELHSSL